MPRSFDDAFFCCDDCRRNAAMRAEYEGMVNYLVNHKILFFHERHQRFAPTVRTARNMSKNLRKMPGHDNPNVEININQWFYFTAEDLLPKQTPFPKKNLALVMKIHCHPVSLLMISLAHRGEYVRSFYKGTTRI